MTPRREYNDRKQWFACALQINFLYKFRKLYRKTPVLESFFNKLIHGCLPVKFARFLRTTFLQKISGGYF